jgi:hypothetical protein
MFHMSSCHRSDNHRCQREFSCEKIEVYIERGSVACFPKKMVMSTTIAQSAL